METWLSDSFLNKQHSTFKDAPLGSDVAAWATYRPHLKHAKPCLAESAILTVHECFDHTDWNIFREAATYDHTKNLEEYIASVNTGVTVYALANIANVTSRPQDHRQDYHHICNSELQKYNALTDNKAALHTARTHLYWTIREERRMTFMCQRNCLCPATVMSMPLHSHLSS